MSKGAQWRAEAKAALAASRRQQRQQRGKRFKSLASDLNAGPGMVRIVPRSPSGDGDGHHTEGAQAMDGGQSRPGRRPS
jgi:hypothetical protein